MFYFLLICSIFILACSLFSITRTIRNINKQIKEKRKIRVSLSNRDIEELAYAINQKDTLHKKLQVQIKQEEDQLKQSISNISHDLRTPLTSIQGYLTLLQECEDKQEQDQYIESLKQKQIISQIWCKNFMIYLWWKMSSLMLNVRRLI